MQRLPVACVGLTCVGVHEVVMQVENWPDFQYLTVSRMWP